MKYYMHEIPGTTYPCIFGFSAGWRLEIFGRKNKDGGWDMTKDVVTHFHQEPSAADYYRRVSDEEATAILLAGRVK